MKEKKTKLITPVIWFMTTAVWLAALCVNLYYGNAGKLLIALQCLCVLTSLIAAVSWLIRYKRDRKGE